MKKKILLIGGTGGLGGSIAKMLAEKHLVTSLGSKDLDITKFRQLQKHFHVNQYDVVLNMSGYSYDSFLHKYDEESIVECYKQIDVNVKGNANLLSTCLPSMRKNGYGRIIILSSVLSDMPVLGTSIYSASKSFIDCIVKTTSLENTSKGITCNSIQLGYFDAGMAHRIPEKHKNSILNSIPLKRFGKMSELYNTINFIIDNEYVTGTSIKIDGGVSL
jgi:NAD(P)-dependent dehydrogenase (short-subunit alcohol dehydrogenase family)